MTVTGTTTETGREVGSEDIASKPLSMSPDDPLSPIGIRSRALAPSTDRLRLGPLDKVYLIWLVGASCDGCTVAVSGATHPRVEDLLNGIIPGLP
ncbi:MAG: hypothetical protein ACYCV7_12470, partial [Acidimicrobiales bacterium]